MCCVLPGHKQIPSSRIGLQAITASDGLSFVPARRFQKFADAALAECAQSVFEADRVVAQTALFDLDRM